MMKKRRVRSHIIADLSVNHVERHALLCGYAVDRVAEDYGIDLILWTFASDGEIEEGQILVQLKATDNLPVLANRQTIAFSVSRADLKSWTAQTFPCILAVYDAQNDRAYWLYIQAYYQQRPEFDMVAVGETVTVHIPITNVLNEAAIQKFRRFKQQILRQTEGMSHDENA